MRDTDAAWAAGYIDGEGCIGLKRSRHKDAAGGVRHQPEIRVAGVDRRPLERLSSLFFGPVNKKAITPSGRTLYEWRIAGRLRVEATLRAVTPYLSCKREQALVLMEFMETMPLRGRRGEPLSEAALLQRDNYVTRLSELKGTGDKYRLATLRRSA